MSSYFMQKITPTSYPKFPKSYVAKMHSPCIRCGESIIANEQYISNEDGELMHYECAQDMDLIDLIRWLGGDIHIVYDDGWLH